MQDYPPEYVASRPPIVQFTAPNPGPKTLTGSHTYLIGGNPAYLIDPGPACDSYQQALAAHVRRAGDSVAGILLTHGHPDHAPGAKLLSNLLDVPVWTSVATPDHEAGASGVSMRFGKRQSFQLKEDRIEVVDTPGHKPDHVVFWLPSVGLLIAGDTILGSGSTLIAPPEGNMSLYLRSLEVIASLKPRLIAPGHGPLIREPATKIAELQQHRRNREAQLVRALEEKSGDVEDLLGRVYVDLSPELHNLARGSLQAQLEKLLDEGRVRRVGSVFTLM